MTTNDDECVDRERMRVAFHEAGHAVMAFVLNRRAVEVTIEPGSDFLGRVRITKLKNFRLDWNCNDRIERLSEREILLLLAGDRAEYFWRKGKESIENWYNDNEEETPRAESSIEELPENALSDDLRIAFRYAGYKYVNPRTSIAYIEYLSCCASDNLALHWSKVEALANALLEKGTLSWKAARQIMKAAEASS